MKEGLKCSQHGLCGVLLKSLCCRDVGVGVDYAVQLACTQQTNEHFTFIYSEIGGEGFQ